MLLSSLCFREINKLTVKFSKKQLLNTSQRVNMCQNRYESASPIVTPHILQVFTTIYIFFKKFNKWKW